MDVTDQELFDAIARNDRAALATLYDRHARCVFALVFHLIGQRTRAEDVIHDLFLELARMARRGERTPHVLRWLVTRALELAQPP